MKTFGGSNRSATPPAGQAPTPAPAANHTPPAKPPASTGRALGGGLPPPDPNAGDGGFEKRDDAYWDAHPLKPGPHEFDCYVSKIVWWANGGITVTFRVTDWDHAANRPNEHHGRQFAWEQGHGKRTGAAYNAWRAEIVGAYAAGDWPEEKWPKAELAEQVPHVRRHHAHAVTVVPGEVGLHQVVGHEGGLALGAAAASDDGAHE